MPDEILHDSAMRKIIYAEIAKIIGREITEEEHEALGHLLRTWQGSYKMQTNQELSRLKSLCGNCSRCRRNKDV